MKLIDALTLTLKELGIEFVFGVSGANIEHFHDAIYRLGDGKLTAILAKSEYSAAFMADALARTHNTLGVCCSTSGGGMTNLAVGIAESFADRIPVLAIVGQIPTNQEGNGGFQDSSGKNNTLNALLFWKSITKYTEKIIDPGMFWSCFKMALQHIFHQHNGPAVLLIPRDLFDSEVPARPHDFSILLSDYRTTHSTDKKSIKKLLNMVVQAKHPLMILGGSMRYTSSINSLTRFVNHFNLKVATTLVDVNAFPQDDPHYLGMIGIAGHPAVHDYLQNKVDLIIAVGEDFSVMVKTPIESTLKTIKTIFIGTDTSKAAAALAIHLMIESDIETFFAHTLKELQLSAEPLPPQPIPKQYYKPIIIPLIDKKKSKGLLTSQALTVVQQFLNHTETILFDAGNCVVSAMHYLQFPKNVKTIISLGMGGMGYAIPAGIGAQLGGPKHKTTWVMTGDGGFLVSGLEIHTAVEYQLPILFIVFNNNMHGMCVTRQQQLFSNRITASTYGTLNVAKTVRGLGSKSRLWVACAKNPLELEHQLTDYCQNYSKKPGVLEIKINIDEVPPFLPFLSKSPEVMKCIYQK